MERSENQVEKPHVILGVTGSIAAYKAADLTGILRKAGAEVHVVMTAAARQLIAPKTFLTLSRNPVVTDLWECPTWQPEHIELSRLARVLVIAPATADILGKMAHGIGDDALSTCYLSFAGPVLVAPAMNPRMWRHPAVQENCRILRSRGVEFAGPVYGEVACGEAGEGRFAPVEEVAAAVLQLAGLPENRF